MIEHETRGSWFWTGATWVSLPILITHRGIVLLARLTPEQRKEVEADCR